MIELIIRVVLASALMAVSGFAGQPDFDLAWRVALVVASYSLVAYQLEQRGMRNPGVAGFVAIADAGAIATVLVSMGRLDQLGFLVLLPCAYANSAFGSNALAMAPIAAGWLLVASNLFGHSDPSFSLLIQALAILVTGLVMGSRGSENAEVEEGAQAVAQPQSEVAFDVLELRESYRQMRDYTRELERKSRRARLSSAVFESKGDTGAQAYTALVSRIRELTGAEGVTLYSVAQYARVLVMRAGTGRSLAEKAFSIDRSLSEAQIRDRFDLAMRAHRGDEDYATASVVLKARGRMVGLVALLHTDPEKLRQAVEKAEEMAQTIAYLVRDNQEFEHHERRSNVSEILYAVASVSSGADTPSSLAARVLREVSETLPLEHILIATLDEGQALTAASTGNVVNVLDAMSFASGPGLAGWLALGAPELALFDARSDTRLPHEIALKHRIGSFVLLPIQYGAEPWGYLCAMTNRIGGIDVGLLDSLRLISFELGNAIGRLEAPATVPFGLATPREFHQAVGDSREGCFVYIEPIHKQELIDAHGRAILDQALRDFCRRLLPRIPANSLLCRRAEGDLVAYLRGYDEAFAQKWANEATAIASLVGLRSLDGGAPTPLGMRARVARLNPQNYQILQELAS